jgi:hypothetical protein
MPTIGNQQGYGLEAPSLLAEGCTRTNHSAWIWVAVEVAIIGYSNEPPLQAVYAILGVAIVLIAARWMVVDGWHGALGAASPR